MKGIHNARGAPLARVAAVAVALAATVCWPARSQAQDGTVSGTGSAPAIAPAAEGVRPRLPRVFFTPAERHERERAEAALSHPAENSAARPVEAPATVHFNGWMRGPGPTHTWINGQRSVAGEPTTTAVVAFDRHAQQLIVTDALGKAVRLKAGESLDPEAAQSQERP